MNCARVMAGGTTYVIKTPIDDGVQTRTMAPTIHDPRGLIPMEHHMKQTTTSTFTDEEREAAAAAYEARREALKFTQYTDRCKTCERLFMKTSAIHVFCSAPCRVKDHHTEKGRIIWMLDKALERAREEIAGLRAEREELLTDMRGRNEREIELAEELARLKARMKAE